MFWTTMWFKQQKEEWKKHWKSSVRLGHKRYAEKQKSIWKQFQNRAGEQFGVLQDVMIL